MNVTLPTRSLRMTLMIFSVSVLLCVTGTMCAQGQHPHAPAAQPHMAPPPQPRRANPGAGAGAANPAPRGGHLNEWMEAHKNLSPTQQQQALENEPGFRQLPAQTQQNLRNRLSQLNTMDPEKRQQLLNRTERMEQLTPDQRGQFRGAMQQLGALPQDQRHVVARSFNELRSLPPEQRAAAMSRIPLNDAQRSTLNNLMKIEPMMPKAEAAKQ